MSDQDKESVTKNSGKGRPTPKRKEAESARKQGISVPKDPKAAKSALIGVGALVVVFGISYALAGVEMLPKYTKFISTSEESKLVSTGLVAFYILDAEGNLYQVVGDIDYLFDLNELIDLSLINCFLSSL
mgnify:CR=1 FL=1